MMRRVSIRCNLKNRVRSWTKPRTSWVNINIDGACGQGTMGVESVIRSGCGDFLRGRCNTINGSEVKEEATSFEFERSIILDEGLERC